MSDARYMDLMLQVAQALDLARGADEETVSAVEGHIAHSFAATTNRAAGQALMEAGNKLSILGWELRKREQQHTKEIETEEMTPVA